MTQHRQCERMMGLLLSLLLVFGSRPFTARNPIKIQTGGVLLLPDNCEQAPRVATHRLADFPTSIKTYRGRSLSAAWRKAADSRIEKSRMAPLTVKVTDPAGKPVANASVTIRMLRHQFTFGSAVAAKLLAADTADSNRYRQVVKENYNKIVFENDLKWDPWNVSKSNTHRMFRREWTWRAFEWLKSNNIAVRGHYIAWAPLKPRQVARYKGKPELLRRELWDHMADKVPAIGTRVTDWDVINHIVGWRDTMETVVGTKDIYVDIVKRARQLAPKSVELWVNEGQVLPNGKKIEAYEQVIRYLTDHGATIDGIGFMGHFNANSLTPPERLYEVFDQFAQLSPNLQITELDVNVGADEQLQADYLRDVMTIAMSHPNMRSLIMWGFWEGRHWRPDAALYRRDWSMKPAGDVWRELVYQRWWTNATCTTNRQGVCTERGFLGDYEVVARVDGKEYSLTTSLTKPGQSVTLVAK